MSDLFSLINNSATVGNPIDALRIFLEKEASLELARQVDSMRFAGYVLELGYDTAKIITSDKYKLAVGGIPRGSFLIMTPMKAGKTPPHFTLLRVTGVSATPLSSNVQQTYFELHKRSMPELDVWTQSELQWGALNCDVLGMFYAEPSNMKKLAFSGDVNNVVSAHRYKVYAPDDNLLKVIINGLVAAEGVFEIGSLRTMECRLESAGATSTIPVHIQMEDFKGTRTAMFGKTRLGKSNVVKLIAQGMLEATKSDESVGQLIFDVNGEYANDNPQDGNKSIRSAYEDRCNVYALTERESTPSKPLRLNFYEQTDSTLTILGSMLAQDNKSSDYISSFYNAVIPSIESIVGLRDDEKTRPIRKIQILWAILYKAGFEADEARLNKIAPGSSNAKKFDPHFNSTLRQAAYSTIRNSGPPTASNSLHELQNELEIIAQFRRENPNDPALTSSSGKAMFDPDDIALLDFLLAPGGRSGPSMLRRYLSYHSPAAGDFIKEILTLLDKGRTIILDLGNATDAIRKYFSNTLSLAVFAHQEQKFVTSKLGVHYIGLYFEEAHNLFPPDSKDLTGVYARFAKEGAKFHIGMVYSTQSPSTINKELLAQTENFFVGHLSSQGETKALSQVQVCFQGIEDDILRAKTPGYMRMLTMSHRFVIPVQAHKFEATTDAK